MINYSNPLIIKIRKLGQQLGIFRPLVKAYRKLFKLAYESNFDQQMMMGISTNDIVWDVGANIGYFTQKFADKVGDNGYVYAFEPTPNTFATLVNNCSNYINITCKNLALSNESGILAFRDSGINNDPTNGIVDINTPNAIQITVASGDALVLTEAIPLPSIIKIDVEGYELEVLQGMKEMLKNNLLKKLFIEVHFFELNKRGMETAVQDIIKILAISGFTVKWADPSHIIASR